MYSDDTFSDAEVAYQLAHITESKAPTIIAAIAALVVLATIAIGLRFFVRWHMKSGLQADDYTIFGAWVYRPQMSGLKSKITWGRFFAGGHSFVSIMVSFH